MLKCRSNYTKRENKILLKYVKLLLNSLIVLVFSHNFLLYQVHYDEEDEDASDDDESDDIVDDVMLEDFFNLEESEEEDEIEEEEGEGEEPVGIDDLLLDRKAEMRQKIQELCRRKREDLEYCITSRDLSALYDFRIDKFQVIFLFKLMACSSL